jgi:Leucine-rich repeat (LRR) protein
LQREFGTEFDPIDGLGGAVGVEHLEFGRKVEEVSEHLSEFRAALGADGSVDVSACRSHSIPESVFSEEAKASCLSLDLSDNLLVCSELARLSEFSVLAVLDLRKNLLVGELPETVGEVRTLSRLHLDSNKLTLVPDSLKNLVLLSELTASQNKLASFPWSVCASWSRLAVLDLRGNQLKEVGPEIASCIPLKRLLLSGNEIASLPDEIGSLRGLEELDLSNNKLTSLPETLSSCRRMKAFRASRNALTALPAELFSSWDSVEEISLFGNKIGDLPSCIGVCRKLKVLALSINSLKSLPAEIGDCTELREVYCNHNAGITALPASIVNWKAIECISFRGCKLKGLPEPEADLATAWVGSLQHLDVTSKGKKPSCKIPKEDFTDKLYRTAIVGSAEKKVKKGKKAK